MSDCPEIIRVIAPEAPQIVRVLVGNGFDTVYAPPVTGSVPRPLTQRLTDIVTLADFGVTPASSDTAVTAALTTAIGALNADEFDTLLIPDGKWMIEPGQLPPLTGNNIHIRGVGKGATLLIPSGAGTGGNFLRFGTPDTRLDQGTLRAATATTAQLATSAPATLPASCYFIITGGTGLARSSHGMREVVAYDGATKTVTLDAAFDITPDATTTYQVLAHDGLRAVWTHVTDLVLENDNTPDPNEYAIIIDSLTQSDIDVKFDRAAGVLKIGSQSTLLSQRLHIRMHGSAQNGGETDANVLIQAGTGIITDLEFTGRSTVVNPNGALLKLKPLPTLFMDTVRFYGQQQHFNTVVDIDEPDHPLLPDGKPYGVIIDDTYGSVNNLYFMDGRLFDHHHTAGIYYRAEPWGVGISRNHRWHSCRISSDYGPVVLFDRQSEAIISSIDFSGCHLFSRGPNPVIDMRPGPAVLACTMHGNVIADFNATYTKDCAIAANRDGWSFNDNTIGTLGNTTGIQRAFQITNADITHLQIGRNFADNIPIYIEEPAAWTTPSAVFRQLFDPTAEAAAGGDPTRQWAVLSADVSTSAISPPASLADLSFLLGAGNLYRLDVALIFQSADIANGIGVTLDGPAGMTHFVGTWRVAVNQSGGTADTILHQRAPGTLSNSTSVDTANADMLAVGTIIVKCGATGGTVTVQFRSETAGTAVVVKAGSLAELRVYA